MKIFWIRFRIRIRPKRSGYAILPITGTVGTIYWNSLRKCVGVPYLYLTSMELSVKDLMKDPRASLTMSLKQARAIIQIIGDGSNADPGSRLFRSLYSVSG